MKNGTQIHAESIKNCFGGRAGALWACKLVEEPQKVSAPDAFCEPFGAAWRILGAILVPVGSQRRPKTTLFGIKFRKNVKNEVPKTMPEKT